MTAGKCSEKKMGVRTINIPIGTRFGKLVVLSYADGGHDAKWRCVCDCGKECTPTSGNLRSGRTKSCGCGRSECTDIMERVRQNITINENGCWIWKAKKDYGTTAIGGRNGHHVRVHCEVYKRMRGPIPKGMFICHNCPGGIDNKACCNPDHLYLGTCLDNARDAVEKGQLHIGDRCSWAKLTAQKAREIFDRYHRGGVTLAILGEEFGVHIMTVHGLVHRRHWRRATEESAQKLGVKNEPASIGSNRFYGDGDDSGIG